MVFLIKRWWKVGASLMGGLALAAFLTLVLRPLQQDSAHVVGFINAEGGSVMHPAELTLYRAFAGKYTLLITGKVYDPVRGDLQVSMQGEHPLNYSVSSRNPPIIPLFNQGHSWYQFAKETFYHIAPGDNLIVYVKVRIPIEPGQYQVTFTERKTGQTVLTVPVTFTDPTLVDSIAPAGEDCH